MTAVSFLYAQLMPATAAGRSTWTLEDTRVDIQPTLTI
jgi:hypothetical protein